jgi:hypothetical protein
MSPGPMIEHAKGISGIYALIDPRIHRVMYVGQSRDIGKRYAQHCDPRCPDRNFPRVKWVEELRRLGLSPGLKILERAIDHEKLDALEVTFVKHYKERSEGVFNVASGGRSRTKSRAVHSSRADWEDLGRQVKHIKRLLNDCLTTSYRVAGTKGSRGVEKTLRAMKDAASQLDSQLARELPDWDGFTAVFYGPDEPPEMT